MSSDASSSTAGFAIPRVFHPQPKACRRDDGEQRGRGSCGVSLWCQAPVGGAVAEKPLERRDEQAAVDLSRFVHVRVCLVGGEQRVR
jgi:hypothetical protein